MVIGGARDWAYDAESLIQLDALTDDSLIMYNFHMYMFQNRTNELKNVINVQKNIQRIYDATNKPAIFTEFGQHCCDTNGECGVYDGIWNDQSMGYAEAIINVAQSNGVSWTTWAWRPGSVNGANPKCQDVNESGNGFELRKPSNGVGADWSYLWPTYGNEAPEFPVIEFSDEQLTWG